MNRLGNNTPWKLIPLFDNTNKLYHFIFYVFFEKFFKSVIRSGKIYPNHLFFNSVFYIYNYIHLPVDVLKEPFKYYRFAHLRNRFRKNTIKLTAIKKFLKMLIISNLFFYKLADTVLVFMLIQLPDPVKRWAYLKSLEEAERLKGLSKKQKPLKKLYCDLIFKYKITKILNSF